MASGRWFKGSAHRSLLKVLPGDSTLSFCKRLHRFKKWQHRLGHHREWLKKGPVDHNAEHRNHSHSHGHGEVDFAEIDPNDTDLLGEF